MEQGNEILIKFVYSVKEFEGMEKRNEGLEISFQLFLFFL